MTSFIKTIKIKKGQKIAQLIVSNIMYPEIKKVESLKETEGNDKGFGEMGKIHSIKKFSDDHLKISYNHLAIKLCSEFIMPIINITKKEHAKEYNEHIKDIIDNLESIKDIYSICSYLMNICCEEYFKLSQNEYLEIKKIIDNNIDIIESMLAPMNDYFDSCKKCYSHYYCSLCIFPQNRYKEFHEKIIKSYFNIWYIKFFYLLQKNIKLNKNIYNISILMNIFMNLYDSSSIDCNKKK